MTTCDNDMPTCGIHLIGSAFTNVVFIGHPNAQDLATVSCQSIYFRTYPYMWCSRFIRQPFNMHPLHFRCTCRHCKRRLPGLLAGVICLQHFRFRLSWTEPFLAFFSAALISPPTPCPMKAVNLTTIDIHSLLAHTPHEESGFVRPSSCQGESTFEVEAFVRIPRGCRRSDLQHLLTSSSSCSSSACKWACSASNACSEQARDTPAHGLEHYVVFVLSQGSLSSSSPNQKSPARHFTCRCTPRDCGVRPGACCGGLVCEFATVRN